LKLSFLVTAKQGGFTVSKKQSNRYFRNVWIFFHQIIRDGALIVKTEQSQKLPSLERSKRGPPTIFLAKTGS
jgi:hypothetical protein